MKRHIDADYTIKALSIFGDKKNGNQHFLNGIETAKEVINNQPTADVVEVVRCKDCVMCVEYMGNMFCGYQSFLSNPEGVSANDYCSKGERGKKHEET